MRKRWQNTWWHQLYYSPSDSLLTTVNLHLCHKSLTLQMSIKCTCVGTHDKHKCLQNSLYCFALTKQLIHMMTSVKHLNGHRWKYKSIFVVKVLRQKWDTVIILPAVGSRVAGCCRWGNIAGSIWQWLLVTEWVTANEWKQSRMTAFFHSLLHAIRLHSQQRQF